MKAQRAIKPRRRRKGRVEAAEAHRQLQERMHETGQEKGSPVANEFSYLERMEPTKREHYPHRD